MSSATSVSLKESHSTKSVEANSASKTKTQAANGGTEMEANSAKDGDCSSNTKTQSADDGAEKSLFLKLVAILERDSVNARDDNGETPLFLACRLGEDVHKSMALLLIEKGGSLLIPDNRGTWPWNVGTDKEFNVGLRYLASYELDAYTRQNPDGNVASAIRKHVFSTPNEECESITKLLVGTDSDNKYCKILQYLKSKYPVETDNTNNSN